MNSLQSLQNEIIKSKLDAVLISSVPDIIYLTNFSHFSKHEREAFLLITKKESYILTDGRYSIAVKSKVKNFDLIEISSKLTFEKALKYLAKKHKIKRVGFNHYSITVAEHKKLSRVLNDLNHFTLDSLRIIKRANEISSIEKACRLGDKTFKYILNKIKLGISEKELAFEVEFYIKKHGADISFPPIVAFGKNSAIPHHKTGDQRLMTNDQILLDFGVKLNNYCSDMTRTVFFGSAGAEYKKMYQTVLEAQQKAISYIQSCHSELVSESQAKTRSRNKFGMTGKEIDKVARDYIISKKYKTIPHSIGHGIGLEVHESPRLSPKSKDVLKPGMVFTIEPGIYIPGFGGVRIEDVLVLEKFGPRNLTKAPRDLIKL